MKEISIVSGKKPLPKPKTRKSLFKKRNASSVNSKTNNYSSISSGTTVSNPKKHKFVDFIKRKKFLLLFLVILLVVGGIFWTKGYTVVSFLSSTGLRVDNPFDVMFGDSSDKFLMDEEGNTNVLALGVDSNREGVFSNVDTIMVVSYNSEGNIARIISIPRDTVVQHTLKTEKKDYTKRYDRINSMYALGEKLDGEGKGLEYLISIVENYLGLDIHYSVVLNFQAFVKVVDSIGGVDIEVENSFIDKQYPNWDYNGYQTVEFTAGMTHMDGDKALKFARSRHGAWPEGTDFARSKRQQKVIAAIQQKINNEKKLQSISFWENLLNALGKNIMLYNVGTNDIKKAYDLYLKNGIPSIVGVVLDPSVGNWTLLGEGVIDFGTSPQFAITPKPDYKNYEPLQSFIKYFFDNPLLIDEKAIVAVYVAGGNVNDVKGLVNDMKEKYPYSRIIYGGVYPKVQIVGYAIFDVAGQKTASVSEYKNFVGVTVPESNEYPSNIGERNGEDIVILVGSSGTE
ncbi:MAG TPA: LCP family protein [Candidatus Dojkabacteria bacterium]|nr:LCP family protein [Candidatus Dojkabacteria bacterium]